MASSSRPFPIARRPAWALALVATLFAACNSVRNSETKSLDNFARSQNGSFRQNACGAGTPEADAADTAFIDEVTRPAAEGEASFVEVLGQNRAAENLAALRQAMRSVPTVVVGAFFSLGGRISVRPDAKTVCSSPAANLKDPLKYTFESEGNVDVTSCVREKTEVLMVDGQEAPVTSMYLYLTDDPAKIGHALVRGMAFAIFDKLSRADLNEEGNAFVFNPQQDVGFANLSDELTKSLLADTASNPNYDLSLYKPFLGKVLATKSPEARAGAWAQFVKESPAIANALRSYVFAETFDSYYCSGDTRLTMQKEFPRTHASFGRFVEGLEALKASLPTVDDANDLKGKSNTEITGSTGLVSFDAIANYDVTPAPEVLPGQAGTPALSLGVFGIFQGLGRAIGGVARGAGRLVVGVGQGAGRIAVGAARVVGKAAVGVGKVAVGVVRATGQVVRGAGRVVVGVAKGTGRVVVGLARGGARLVGGAARAAGRAIGWTVMATGHVVHGFFGAFAHLAGCATYTCAPSAAADEDYDLDGVADRADQCVNTGASNVPTYKSGTYAGCGGGQLINAGAARMIVENGYEASADQDGDGVPNEEDFCSNTPKGAAVSQDPAWRGCATKQRRDDDLLRQAAANAHL